MNDKNRVPVEIDGMKFNILGEEDERYIKYIASYVDKVIHETNNNYPENNRIENLILTLVNLKDKIEKEKEEFRGSSDFQKLREYENLEVQLKQAQEEINSLNNVISENKSLIQKYKERDVFCSNRLKEEASKVKQTYNQLKQKSEDNEKILLENKKLEDLIDEVDIELTSKDEKIKELEEKIRSLEEGFNSI